MNRKILLAGVLSLLLASILLVCCPVSASTQTLTVSYSDGTVEIEGQADTCHSGGVVTFAIFNPDGSLLSDAYTTIGSSGSYSCKVDVGVLQHGIYLVEADHSITGAPSVKLFKSLNIGPIVATVNAAFSDDIVTISGQAPRGYEFGVITCSVLHRNNVVTDAYASIGDDGTFSVSIDIQGVEEGVYLIRCSFDQPGLERFGAVTHFVVDSSDFPYGNYDLRVLNTEQDTDNKDRYAVTYESISRVGGTGYVGAKYVLSYERVNDSLCICGFDSTDRNVVVLIPAEVEIEGKVLPVHSISDVGGEGVFSKKSNITGVVFSPDSTIDSIPLNTFFNDRNLKFIEFSDSITSIGMTAFQYTGLTDLVLPKNLREIGGSAFSGTNLNTVKTADGASGLSSISYGAFSCDTLKVLEIPMRDLTYLDPRAIQSISIERIQSTNGYGIFTVPNDPGRTNWIFKSESESSLDLVSIPLNQGAEIQVPEGVTSISAQAGLLRSNEYVLSLPASLERIDGSFAGSKLVEIVFAEGSKIQELNDVFGETDITSIDIPSSVTSLDHTFRGCKKLQEVRIGGAEVQLDRTFNGCKALTGVSFADNARIVLKGTVFGNCSFDEYAIPEGVIRIEGPIFSGCTKLTKVTIPNSLEYTSDDAFSGCNSLKTINTDVSNSFVFENGILLQNGVLKAVPGAVESIIVPASVTSFGTYFQNLKKLTSFGMIDCEIRNLEIPGDCFKGCSNLMEVVLSSDVRSIGDNAFSGCTKLSEVHLADGSMLTSIGNETFKGTGLLEFYVPSTVVSIGLSAFENCSTLGVVSVPSESELRSIGSKAFSNTAIRAFFIPGGVQDIGDSCFKGCNLLSVIQVDESNGHYSMVGGGLCDDSALLFVPAGSATLSISENISSFNRSAFDSASTLAEIHVDSNNQTFSSENGILLNKDGSRVVYVPSDMKNVRVPSKVAVLEGFDNRSPLRDCSELESFVFQSELDTITIKGGFFTRTNHGVGFVDLVVLSSPNIVIEQISTDHGGIGTLVLICNDLKITGSHTYNRDIGILVVETKTCSISNYAESGFTTSVLCTNNVDLPLSKLISSQGSLYVADAVSDFELEVGNLSGIYVLDHESWIVNRSSFMLDDKPVFVSDVVDNVDIVDVCINNDKVVVKLRNAESTGVSWDVDVYVNGKRAENSGGWIYEILNDPSAVSYDISISPHVSAIKRTVTFHIGESSDTRSVTVPDGRTLLGFMPEDPKRNGYDFGGWFLDDSCTIALEIDSRVESDLDVYAKWTSRDTVLFEYASEHGTITARVDGTVVDSGTLYPKGTCVDLSFEARNGWEFLNWMLNGSRAELAGNSITLESDVVVSVALRYTSQSNSLTNIIDIKTPRYGEDVTLQWSHHYDISTDMDVWSGFPSVPAIMDGSVYIRASDRLYKIDASTGSVLADVQSQTLIAYYLYLGVGGGVVVDYATDKAYDADLNFKYNTPKKFVSVFYNEDDGRFYGLCADRKVFRFDAETGSLDNSGKWGSGIDVTWFGLYGTTSAPVFVGDHMYIVSARTTSDYRGLTEITLSTGDTSTIELKGEAGRLLDDGWLTHYAYNGKDYLFLTTYSKGLLDTKDADRTASIIGVEVGSDGKLSDSCKSIRLDTSSQTLSAFVVFKGRGYASGYVMDADKICDAISNGTSFISKNEAVSEGYQIYKEDYVSSHGSIVLTTAYATEENDYTVYIYSLAYNPSEQAVYIFEDNQMKTVAGKYYKTSPAGSAYGSQAVRATKDGNLVWYTDSGTVFCYGTPANNPYNFDLIYNGKERSVSGIGYTALEALKNALKTSGLDYSINNSGIISSIDHTDGVWNIEYKDGDGWRKAGLMSADYINVYHTFRITYLGTAEVHPIDVSLNPDSLVLYASGSTNRTATITATIDCDWEYDIQWSLKGSSVSIDGPRDQRTVTVRSESLGDSTLMLFVESGRTKNVVECKISVVEPPAKLNTYKFFIQMKYDADKVKHSKYNQTMLEEGIEIQAEGVNALDAFEKACAQNGIPFDPYSNETLKGWFNSLFGLGDVNMGNGAWKYWVQYHEGVYNDKTLGYYTEGGNFQFIYDITTMGDVPGGEDKPDPKPTITDKGEIKTETSSEKKNEDGSTTKIDTETTEGLDGSKHEVETRTDVSEDGSTTTTTTTTTKTDPEGNQTKSESVTVVEKIKDAEGNDAERKTVTEKDQDGNIKQSVSDITTSKDGTVTEKTKGTETKKDGSSVDSSTTTETKKDGTTVSKTESTAKDANGNVTGTTKSETTTEKISGGTKSSTTETSHDKDGNITGVKETEETKTESGTKIVERSKDADGNVTGSSEKTVETQAKGNGSVTTTTEISKDADGKAVSSTETKEQVANRTIAGGKTQTTTTTDSKTTDSSGNVVSSTESAVVVKNKDGTPESFESTKVVKDQNGTVIEEIKKGTTNTKDSNGNEVSKTEYTKTTPEGKTSVDSETVFKKIDNGSQTDSTKTTVVKDKDGKVIDETKVIKTGKNTETDTEKKNSSSTETIRNGVSETKESSSVESKDVSGLKSSVEVEKKGDSIIKAESVTTLPTKDGNVDADSVQKAIDQSSAAMDEVSVDNKEISKTIEVKNDSGASVTVSPEAIGKISEHGAGLKVGRDNESIHVDDKVVENLSGNADKDVKLEMDKNTHDDLNDKQKQIVGDRQFIVLGAFVGDSRIHELGGVATVVFGYELRVGDGPSRLCVWYVDDNGVRTKMTASFDQSTGRFTMETTHFSVFMVAPEDEPVPTPDDSEDSDGNGSDTMLYVSIAAIVIVLIAAVAAIHRRKA